MAARAVHVCVLGPAAVRRNGVPEVLPRSRKVRALLAFLALRRSPVSRSRLCDLLWDDTNDPRGELRWCLSKLRGLLDDPDRRRVVITDRDLVALDLSDCIVDALEVEKAFESGLAHLGRERLVEIRDHFGGDLLDGVEIDGNPELTGWLAAQRQRYRTMHVAVLKEMTTRAPTGEGEIFRHVDEWLRLSPFDVDAHRVMLEAQIGCGRWRDAEDHVAAVLRAFEQEKLDTGPLRDAWSSVRAPRVQVVSPSATQETPVEARVRRRASVAVLPFVDKSSGRGRIADGITDDIITRLAKLRVLFVIARGTAYALAEKGIDAHRAGRLSNVQYVVTGSVRRQDERVSVVVELAETENARIVWTDEIEGVVDDTFAALDAIVGRIVAAIAEEIETAESQRAILKPPSSLDAWEAYHRGLWHMYKFRAQDNRDAEHYFRAALALDPTFSRAYAGLSFTHFQNAFLDLTPDRDRQIELAFESAGRSVDADDRDPAAHWAMGRALWLRGVQSESFVELQRSIELSPNFALGHYTLGFVESQKGNPQSAIDATNYSRELSPFDPLQFAMLASRALAHVRLGELDEAVEWAVKAAGRPNAHAHILAIAAECLALTDRRDHARTFVARIRDRVPSFTVEDFLRSFRFGTDTEALFRSAARTIGFD